MPPPPPVGALRRPLWIQHAAPSAADAVKWCANSGRGGAFARWRWLARARRSARTCHTPRPAQRLVPILGFEQRRTPNIGKPTPPTHSWDLRPATTAEPFARTSYHPATGSRNGTIKPRRSPLPTVAEILSTRNEGPRPCAWNHHRPDELVLVVEDAGRGGTAPICTTRHRLAPTPQPLAKATRGHGMP